MKKEEILKERIKLLNKEIIMWKKAYFELNSYFDSISDEEQPKVSKRLNKIFGIKL